MNTYDKPTRPVEHCRHTRSLHYHGTQVAYARCACRCEHCTAASTRYKQHHRAEQARKAKAKAAQAALHDKPTSPIEGCQHAAKHVHGTSAAYTTCKCRCDDCRAANNRRLNLSRNGYLNKKNEALPEGETQGHYLHTEPRVDRDTARAAALAVLRHTPDDTIAAEILGTLGIKELAQ